jgi:outer membrane autotransporter protein
VAPGATVNLSNPSSTAGGASGITVANGFNNAGTVSVARGVTGVINGAYTQTSTGEYKLGASSTSSYGVLAVNGTVDLPSDAKIYVDVATDNTLTNKQVLHGVITSTGLTASTFDVTDNLDLVSFTGKIDGNNVDLVTKVNALVLQDVLANGNYNAAPAAKVIDEIIATNSNGPFAPVIDDLAKLQTSQQVSRTVSQFLPLLSGASNVSTIGTLWQLDQVIQSRLDGNPGLSSGDDYLTDRGAWVKPFGTWGNQSDQGSAPGFTSNTGGIVLGADGAVSQETRLGLAFAYASSDITGKGAEASDENKVDLYQLVGYGSYALDPVTEVNFQIDGGGNTNKGHRPIPAFGTNASSSYNSSTAHFGVGIGRSLPIDDSTMWTPSARIDYTWVRSDSYGETGAGPLNLNVQSASAEQLLTSVDAKIVHKITDYASVFGNLGVGYDSLARNNTQIISAFAGAPGLPFATQGVGLKPWTVLAGFGVVATPQGGPEITVRYDLQDRSSFTEQSFSVKARWAF